MLRQGRNGVGGPESGDSAAGGAIVKLAISALRKLYRERQAKPSDVLAEIYDRIGREPQPVWISLVPRERALSRARELESNPAAAELPLYGIPFAMKDNIDVAGVPTTAGCPAFAYTPQRSATVVERLLAAGAIVIGKTNLDQFATGLVGTRSPYGACSSVYRRALYFRRIELGLGGGGGEGAGELFAGDGHRGIGPRTGGIQ